MNHPLRGICRLSVVPMRKAPLEDSRLVSELLFGEHYTVLEQQDHWLRIELHFDHFQGWISRVQHTTITEEYFQQVNMSDYKVCTDIGGTIYFQKKNVQILLGSILPITTHELFKAEEQVAFNGESKRLAQKREFDFIKEVIKKYMHTPYRLGGKTPFGIDPAGFIQQVFKIGGYRLPRTLDEQTQAGKPVEGKAKAGDMLYCPSGQHGLICWSTKEYVGVIDGQVKKTNDLKSIIKAPLVRRVMLMK